MKAFLPKLQSDQEGNLLETFTDLLAKLLMSMSLFFLHWDIHNCDAYLTLLLLGDCHAKNAKWMWNDIVTAEGTQLEIVTGFQKSDQVYCQFYWLTLLFMLIANTKLPLPRPVLQRYFAPKICVLNKLTGRAKLMSF